MANCQDYQRLSTQEKTEMIGQIVHAMQNDPVAFITCRGIINGCKARGVFDNVKFMPEREEKAEVNY